MSVNPSVYRVQKRMEWISMNDIYNFMANDYYAIQEAVMLATFICALIAVVGTILIYAFFLTPENRGRFSGFLRTC